MAKGLKQVALNLSDLEMKTLEATNTDPWGPHGTTMYEIASACVSHEAFAQVFAILSKRLGERDENWRQAYKALLVIEYLIKHCPRFAVEHIKDEAYHLRRLRLGKYPRFEMWPPLYFTFQFVWAGDFTWDRDSLCITEGTHSSHVDPTCVPIRLGKYSRFEMWPTVFHI